MSFEHASPDIDESPMEGESASDLAMRLSEEKARALAERYPGSLIIGSDQVGELEGKLVGKPGEYDAAFKALKAASGKELSLHTGVALLNTGTNTLQCDVDVFHVRHRLLDEDTIRNYLLAEEPYDCCGALKAEGPGIALLERLTGDDPNTLIGLPLIRLLSMLENEGVRLF